MPSALWTGTLAIIVAVSILIDLLSSGSGPVAAVAGFGLVCCGTLLMARLSHAGSALRSLASSLREVRRARDPVAAEEQPLHWFLTAANLLPLRQHSAGRGCRARDLAAGAPARNSARARRPREAAAHARAAAHDRRGARAARGSGRRAARDGDVFADARHARHAARAVADAVRRRHGRRREHGRGDGLRDDDHGLRARASRISCSSRSPRRSSSTIATSSRAASSICKP